MRGKQKGTVAYLGLIVALSLILAVLLPSGVMYTDPGVKKFPIGEEIPAMAVNMRSDALAEVYDFAKVYRLKWDELPCPKPDPDKFTDTGYEDETIKVTTTCERLVKKASSKDDSRYNCEVYFAEVEIAHPTQIRTAWSFGKDGNYDTSTLLPPVKIAKPLNAVVAVNADFASFRTQGLIFRQDTLVRNNPGKWDALLIDDRGDFHIVRDNLADIDDDGTYRKENDDGSVSEYHIVNSMDFGPSLVVDGEIQVDGKRSVIGSRYSSSREPRTAVGQIGELHYLVAVVCGRGTMGRDGLRSYGISCEDLAEIMYDRGCVQAYNLDGGLSAMLILDDQILNPVPIEGFRIINDILFFATAVGERPSPESN